jgi:hypothetical protein
MDEQRLKHSTHKTPSALRRYHIINLDDLRRAALRGSDYTGKWPFSNGEDRARVENMVRTW